MPGMQDSRIPRDAARTDSVLRDLQRMRGTRCTICASGLCGHQAVMCLAMGFKNAPRCLGCLAAALGRHPEELRDHLYAYIEHHECYLAGWEWASREEGFDPTATPGCLWAAPRGVPARPAFPEADKGSDGVAMTAEWDAGDMGCGDLVLELRMRIQALRPGEVLKLTARDPGAPQDLPAWCRLTGHTLLRAEHPEYWIQRKER
jgi:tRNA 2-thiouridine synthesizing protein A